MAFGARLSPCIFIFFINNSQEVLLLLPYVSNSLHSTFSQIQSFLPLEGEIPSKESSPLREGQWARGGAVAVCSIPILGPGLVGGLWGVCMCLGAISWPRLGILHSELLTPAHLLQINLSLLSDGELGIIPSPLYHLRADDV